MTQEKTKSTTKERIKKRLASVAIFIMMALFLAYEEPTIEIAWVSAILLLTIYLFAFEVVEVDIAAMSIMVLLGLTSLFAPIMGLEKGLVDPNQLFIGFSSNAVISIIAVMIIGAGLDKTGIMSKVAAFILNVGGTSEKRIIPIVSSTVAFISSFMQNVGAAALFLPVVSRISARSGLSMSRLLMPMGFCAILGGTVTMVGSSPLILLNDLILTSNTALPADQQMNTWGLFSVTPIGIALVVTGILYFVIAGRFVLPATKSESSTTGSGTMKYFHDVYGIDYELFELVIPEESELIGKHLDDVETKYHVRVIATKLSGQETHIGPGALDRDTGLRAGMVLGVVAEPEDLEHFTEKYGLKRRYELRTFSEALASTQAGIAEVVIPPGSKLIGKSARAEWDMLLFFYGVVLCVGGFGFMGYLSLASDLMYTQWGATSANIAVGVLSAIVDNIPVMFAVLSMQPEMGVEQWLLVTMTAGVGGSLLSIGSAAGVALMGQARGRYTFFSHLKWTPVIALGYVASIYVHMLINF